MRKILAALAVIGFCMAGGNAFACPCQDHGDSAADDADHQGCGCKHDGGQCDCAKDGGSCNCGHHGSCGHHEDVGHCDCVSKDGEPCSCETKKAAE